MTDQINITAALLDGTDVSFTAFGKTIAFTDYGNEVPVEEPPISAIAFDAKTAAISEDLVSVSHGHISPRAGGGTYINLTELPPGNTITQITGETAEGQAVTIPVTPRRMLKGFSDGRHWMLPVDKATGRIKFEPGRSGRKYFVTKRPRNDPGGKGGYTAQDIATADGVSLATVTRGYVKASTKWGCSADFPLEMNWGFAVWGWATGTQIGGGFFQSNWLVLERGYDYRDGVWPNKASFFSRATSGESPLHPALVTCYGTGDDPKITQSESALDVQEPTDRTWLAYDGVELPMLKVNGRCSMLLTHVRTTKEAFVTPSLGHVTIHRCCFFDAHLNPPAREDWGKNNSPTGYPEHTYGTYASSVLSFLNLESYYDHNGWHPDYNPESNLTIYPYYPFSLSHNVYLTFNFVNTTIRRHLNFRAASQGIQNRGGGTWEDVLIVDANMIGNNLGRAKSLAGASDTPDAGNIPTIRRSINTSAGHKKAIVSQGNIAGGIDITGYDGFIEMIIMHKANPASATEIARKTSNKPAWDPEGVQARGYKSRVRVHNWNGYIHDNGPVVWNRDPAVLNAATIQNFAETRMDLSGVAEDAKLGAYADWLRTRTPTQREAERKAATAYFYAAWGVTITERGAAATCAFIPNTEEGSGVLYADFVNWSTKDIPGKVFATDTVEARGVNVRFGEETVDLTSYNGQGGTLELSSGKMTVGTLTNVPTVKTIISGQIWLGAQTAVGNYTAESGRIAWTGAATGHNLTVDGQYPEVLLGPNHTIASGKTLDIRCGVQGAVGWDGTGTATLTIASGGTLRLRNYAGAYGARMSRLERFRSGALGDGETEPTVTVSLVLASGSIIAVDTTGLAAGPYDLTGPGVTVTNNGATLPAGVSVTGGKLVLTVS